MPLSLRRSALSLLVWVFVLGVAAESHAAQPLRARVFQRGDFEVIGNTLAQDCHPTTPYPLVGTLGSCGSEIPDGAPDVFWRSGFPTMLQAEARTSVTAENASSVAVLSLPAGASITHAWLYWGAGPFAAEQSDLEVTLARPGTFSEVVAAATVQNIQTAPQEYSYQWAAEVTPVVQRYGPGAYQVSGVPGPTLVNTGNNFGFIGWRLVVLYEVAGAPLRVISVHDGLEHIKFGVNISYNDLTGFRLTAGSSASSLFVAAYEGDSISAGDHLRVNFTEQSNALNPQQDFFNGTRSRDGVAVSASGDLPQLTGTQGSMSGLDLDRLDISSSVASGSNLVRVEAATSGEDFLFAGLIFTAEVVAPELSAAKSFTDLNGGRVLPGDVLELVVQVSNAGEDAREVLLNEVIPTGLTYVPGSLVIDSGANAGSKTDSAGDDQAEFLAAGRSVRFRLGTGANGFSGGVLPNGGATQLRFRVQVDAGAVGTLAAQAEVLGVGNSSGSQVSVLSDGDPASPGRTPTLIVVDRCEVDTQCGAPAPYCDLGQSPAICVECVSDMQCGFPTPSCEPEGRICVCVPTGAESCDGVDNDCNGVIDDGNPGSGASCNTGLEGVCEAGVTACEQGALSCVATVSPGSTPELCNGSDDDCDGEVDEEDPEGGAECSTGEQGVCATGSETCVGGALVCQGIPPGTVVEACNGLDDDCDGTLDDGCPVDDAGVPDAGASAPQAESGDELSPVAPTGCGCGTSGGNGAGLLIGLVFLLGVFASRARRARDLAA